jgi:NADPH2:quinone reductase
MTMKALYIEKHGNVFDLKVSDIPAPKIKPGEVLIKVEASAINPSDVASVQGRFPNAILPRIVGRDFAGKVVDGPPGVIDAEVWGSGGDLGTSRNGTHAEYLAIPVQAVARRPKNLSAEEAAVVGVPFITAYSALFRLGHLKEGECVIISGAAGAVGQAAIQLAHVKGARIVALVKDASESSVSKSGSVQAIAQSDRGNLEAVVREATNDRGADLALNGVGAAIFGPLLSALAVNGRQVVYSAAGGREFALDILSFYRQQFALFGLDTQKLDATACSEILNEIAPLFESGALHRPAVGERYKLSEAPRAYQHVAEGQGGKAVLVLTGSPPNVAR